MTTPPPPVWPSHRVLAAFAKDHLEHELRSLYRQATDPLLNPGTERNHQSDALLEACLVHLRLLDEFLSRDPADSSPQPRKDDVVAGHFLTNGQPPGGFLDVDERDDINSHLMHLAARRRPDRKWPVRDLARRCGLAIVTTFDDTNERLRPDIREEMGEPLSSARSLASIRPTAASGHLLVNSTSVDPILVVGPLGRWGHAPPAD